MNRQFLHYAIVGLGHGLSHASAIAQSRRGRLVALCDSDSGRLAAAGRAAGVTPGRCHIELDDLLAADDVHAVVLATHPPSHRELAERVLAAGKHLLLEKPIAHHLADAEAIEAAAAGAEGRTTQIGFCVRSSPWIRRFREVIESGAVGRPLLLWFNMAVAYRPEAPDWFHDPDQGGSKLVDCCCHYLDVMQVLAGSPWKRVCCFGGPPGVAGPNRRPPEVANVIVECQEGCKLTLNLSERTDATHNSQMGLFGSAGKIEADPWLPEGAGSLRVYEREGLYTTDVAVSGQKASTGHLGFVEQHENFAATVLDGAPNVCDAASAVENLRLVLAAVESARTGEVIER